MENVKISNIAVYRGSRVVDNGYYIDHFKQHGKDVKHFFCDVMGKNKRYLVDPEKENSLTMAIEASKMVLENSKLTGKDIDMIVYSSLLPEYVAPPSSIHLHSAIHGKHDCICYDINVNCAGMTFSLPQICNVMLMNSNIKRTLLVGSDYFTPMINPQNEYTYGHFGDAACAVILEKTTEPCGLLGVKCYVNSSEHQNILFPKCGFTKALSGNNNEDYHLEWKPFTCETTEVAAKNMKMLLSDNGLSKDDVKMYCFSQYALALVKDMRSLMNVDESRSLYIGNEYGYTATSSPFIVLYEALKRGIVQRGDHIMFWTIGAGSQNVAVLYRY
jgi:3-oxoacyl-[acyl-carrier-protein] synthase-3